jgi:hypothetical protein
MISGVWLLRDGFWIWHWPYFQISISLAQVDVRWLCFIVVTQIDFYPILKILSASVFSNSPQNQSHTGRKKNLFGLSQHSFHILIETACHRRCEVQRDTVSGSPIVTAVWTSGGVLLCVTAADQTQIICVVLGLQHQIRGGRSSFYLWISTLPADRNLN